MFRKFLLSCFIPLFLYAQPEIPQLKYYANDFTGTLSNSQLYDLNSLLKSFDDSTSTQIVFLMIPTLNGYPIEDYTYKVASENKIGTEKNNNGVLFFVAKNDRKMRIEVGYGLEAVLPDALASSILRNEVRPYFINDDYYDGIKAGLKTIIDATKGEYKNSKKNEDEKIGFPFIYLILFLIIFLLSGRRGGGLGTWLLLGSILGSSGRRGGGGFGGGGFGGFSGGGGSFGGGGASGSW
ncbi:YgcG family protein [Melioribacteraceae bacterium 4301-Me]|uniref:TPM domain-containing protein n=1 Tax=Pyranulibacter aquaticus TaxID=3163344 RepID=UPI003599A617